MTEFKDQQGNIIKKCPTPIGHTTNRHGIIFPIRCKSWNCPYCSQINRKRVLDRVSAGFGSDLHVRGFCLTEGSDVSSKEISKHWAKLRSALFYYTGHLKYFKVTEFTPDSHLYYNQKIKQWKWTEGNRRHYHILTDQYIPWKILKKLWRKVTNDISHIIFIKDYNIHDSAGYLSKYLIKSSDNIRFGRHERRYSFSQNDGFVFDKVRQQIQYNFRLPEKGEHTFHLGAPKFWRGTQGGEVTGNGGGAYYPEPYKSLGWHLYTKRYLEFLSQGEYLQVDKNYFELIHTHINSLYNGIIQKHYIEQMILDYNRVF